MSMNYTVSLGEGADVPMSADQIAAAYAAGTIKPGTLLWRDGLEDWQTLSALAGELGITIVSRPPVKPLRPTPASLCDDENPVKRPVAIKPYPVRTAQMPVARPAQYRPAQVMTNMVDAYGNPVVMVVHPKSRIVFFLAAFLVGTLGIHNFYAGRAMAGVIQLLLTVFVGAAFPPLVFVFWIFNILEGLFVNVDGRGMKMK